MSVCDKLTLQNIMFKIKINSEAGLRLQPEVL